MMTRYTGLILFMFFSLMPLMADGQGKAAVNEEIAGKFITYCRSVPREEVYIHTDRDEYIAGEPVWFNTYLFNRLSLGLSEESSVIYVELLNSLNFPVIQKKVRIEKGSGPGIILLPDTLSTGKYLLRAYTNWMKNFLPDNCFMKEISVYNSISSRRIIGKDISGAVAGVNETAVNSQASERGFSVNINSSDRDTINILITANESFRLGNGSTCYLFIQTHGVINFNEPVKIYGASTSIPVPKKTLMPGINQVTLFNSAGEPIFEKYMYTPSTDNESFSLNVPGSVHKRSKVLIEIDLGYVQKSDLSISVSAANTDSNGGIGDYLVFGTEFGTLPEAIRGKKLGSLPLETINDFLATSKSNWLNWKNILAGQVPNLKYRMENEYHNLSGFLMNKNTMTPDTGQYVFLSRPGKEAYFQYAKTGIDGKFSFEVPKGLSGKDIVIQPADPGRNDNVRIESSFPGLSFPTTPETKSLSVNSSSLSDRLSVNYQVGKIYNSSSVGEILKQQGVASEPGNFYGKPDNTLLMDNYIKLPVMQEVFFELIPGVYLKNKKSEWEMTIADPVDFSIYTAPPMLLIDGVVVKDASLIANLDPELIERIETVRDKYLVGDYLIYGLVNVITRLGNFSCISLPDYAVRLQWSVADQVYSFASPEYTSSDKKNNHVPDFRSTLYWNPSLRPGKDGKYLVEFWSSDFASDYIIEIEGISTDGKTVSLKKTISVR
jgi:hypothetical protein